MRRIQSHKLSVSPEGIALTAILISVTAAIFGFGGVYYWVWIPLTVFLIGVTIYILIRLQLGGKRIPISPLFLPAGLFAAFVGFQWKSGVSIAPAMTLDLLLQLIGCGCFFFLATYCLRRSHYMRIAAYTLWMISAVLAGESLLQYFTSNKHIYWLRDASYGTPVGPFVYHNHFAGCMVLLLPVALMVAFRPVKEKQYQWIDWLRRAVVPATGLSALIVSQSRGGIIALLAEIVVAMLLFWRPRKSKSIHPSIFLLGVLLAGSVIVGLQPLVARFSQLKYHDASAVDRVRVAETCLEIFRDHRWFGTGFGTFTAVYPQYQKFDDGLIWNAAHNEYAQILAETGLVGAALVLLFAGMYFYLFWVRQRGESGFTIFIQRSAFVGSIGLLVHSTGDFQFHAFSNALLFFLLVSMASVKVQRSPKKRVMQDHNYRITHA